MGSLCSRGSNDRIDLARRHSIRAGALCRGLHRLEFLRRRREGIDVVFDAHDDNRRLAAAIHHKTFIFLVARLMIWPSWVRAVRAETMLVVGFDAVVNLF